MATPEFPYEDVTAPGRGWLVIPVPRGDWDTSSQDQKMPLRIVRVKNDAALGRVVLKERPLPLKRWAGLEPVDRRLHTVVRDVINT